jgi:hypothetical protein
MKAMKNISVLTVLIVFAAILAGVAQRKIPSPEKLPVKVNYISFRPAKWEEKKLIEEVNENRNMGGLVFVYYTNSSDKPVKMREWNLNRYEAGHCRLAGTIAWDRRYTDELQPGETSVQEICGVSEDFQIGKNADFAIIGRDWKPVAYLPGVFEPEKLRVTSMTMDETLTNICIHIRSFISDEISIKSITFEGKKNKELILTAPKIEGNGHVIARVLTEQAFTPGELALVKISIEINGKEINVYSHRNAYADYFPNGTWGIEVNQYADAAKHHLNTMVKGGKSTDKFFSGDYKTTGIKAMPHTEIFPNIEMIKDLENHPAVACWYLQDEPDWNKTPQMLFFCNEMTKKISVKKPTLTTLCRNVKFFEFAFIPDIPCHDHYSVTAPTTSKWPYKYGTRLEETGYYTADLKCASEPKPVWVWTQGLHLWSERPKMPLPTPDELGAQLYFNLGRGAKGNLWFTFMEKAGIRFPETKKALQQYSRVVKLLENDMLLSDPWHGNVAATDGIDVASLITPDKLILFAINTNYQINDSAYQWKPAENVKISLSVPEWFWPVEAFETNPQEGIKPADWKIQNKAIELNIKEVKMGSVYVFSMKKKSRESFESRFSGLLKHEQ